MTTATRRFILRVIVGLVTFLIGVAVAMAFAGFRPFETNQSERQQNYRHYHRKQSCTFEFRSWNVPPPPPPAPPAASQAGTTYLKGPDGVTVILEK